MQDKHGMRTAHQLRQHLRQALMNAGREALANVAALLPCWHETATWPTEMRPAPTWMNTAQSLAGKLDATLADAEWLRQMKRQWLHVPVDAFTPLVEHVARHFEF